jgi:hypothetical protein
MLQRIGHLLIICCLFRMSEVLADTTSASVDSEGNIHDATNVPKASNLMQYGTFESEYTNWILFKIIYLVRALGHPSSF